jgi:hypothetical protein
MFVPNKELVDIVAGIAVNFIQPFVYVVEAFLITYIIHNLHMFINKMQENIWIRESRENEE